MLNNRQKKTIGVILIITGILLPLASVPLSSAYGGHGSLLWCLVRVIWTGEIVFREGAVKVVPDRDEQLYAEFIEYKRDNRELESLPEDHIVERFYNARYKDRMPRVLFDLKLEKKQVITIQRKIAVFNRYFFIAGILLIIAGAGILILAKKKSYEGPKKLELQGFLNKFSNAFKASSFSLPDDLAEDSLKAKKSQKLDLSRTR